MNKIYKGQTVEGEPAIIGATWSQVQMYCATLPRFIVEARPYDEAAEISIQQMRYFHAVIIKEYCNAMGESEWFMKIWLKREFGRQMFMVDVCTDEERRGQIIFECQNPQCRHLFFLPLRARGDKFLCPSCKKGGIQMFFMLSIAKKTVNDVSAWLENMWAGYSTLFGGQIERPDPNWRINKSKKKDNKNEF